MEALGVAVGREETKAAATVAFFRGERGRGREGGREGERDGGRAAVRGELAAAAHGLWAAGGRRS